MFFYGARASTLFALLVAFPRWRPGGSADFPDAGEPKKYGMGHQGAKHAVSQGIGILFWLCTRWLGNTEWHVTDIGPTGLT